MEGYGAIVDWYSGWRDIQGLVHERIQSQHKGELPVGKAEIIDLDDDAFRFLIYAPIMKGPSDISKTNNVFLAMRAILRAVGEHNQKDRRKIKKVAISGLGTGVGYMKPEASARQIREAFGEKK